MVAGAGSRTAVIVGASSGIGEALARRLARRGWRLALAARRVDRLQALAAELGPATTVCRLDLGAPDQARADAEACSAISAASTSS